MPHIKLIITRTVRHRCEEVFTREKRSRRAPRCDPGWCGLFYLVGKIRGARWAAEASGAGAEQFSRRSRPRAANWITAVWSALKCRANSGANMLCHKINPTLELRLLQPADAAELYAVIDADRVRLREWLPWVDDTKKVADSAKFIAKALRERTETRAFTSGIWSMGRLVGVIRHNRIDWASKVSFPTYWLASSAQGCGIMTQCCQAFYSHAFELLQVHRIVVAVATENKRGQALPLRLGFKQVSLLKKAERLHDRWVDHQIYSLLTPHAPPGSF